MLHYTCSTYEQYYFMRIIINVVLVKEKHFSVRVSLSFLLSELMHLHYIKLELETDWLVLYLNGLQMKQYSNFIFTSAFTREVI